MLELSNFGFSDLYWEKLQFLRYSQILFVHWKICTQSITYLKIIKISQKMGLLRPKIWNFEISHCGTEISTMAVAPQWIISDKQLLVPKSIIGRGFHPYRTHSDTKFCLLSLLVKFGWHYHLNSTSPNSKKSKICSSICICIFIGKMSVSKVRKSLFNNSLFSSLLGH